MHASIRAALALAALASSTRTLAQSTPAQSSSSPAPQAKSSTPAAVPAQAPGSILLTVFLKHDQSKNLTQINDELWKNGYFDRFPPEGVEVVSWYVVMNIGQVVTLRVPAEKLREVNVVLEQTAWGPYRTDFFPTYDYKQLAEQQRATMRARKR